VQNFPHVDSLILCGGKIKSRIALHVRQRI